MGRTWAAPAGAGAVTLAVAVVFGPPLIAVPTPTSEVSAVLLTAASLVALLLAILAYGRFRARGRARDVLLVYGLTILAFASLSLAALPGLLPGEPTLSGKPAFGALETVAAVFLAIAAWGGRATIDLSAPAWRDLAAIAFASGTVVALVALAFSFQPALSGSLAVAVVGAIAFVVAGVGYARGAVSAGDAPIQWLAVGCFLAGGSLAAGALRPEADASYLGVPEVLGAGFFLALGLAAVSQMRANWHGLAAAAVYEERRRIARDLHDGLAQELAYIATVASTLKSDDENGPIRGLRAAAERALDESRRAIAALTSPSDEELGDAITRTSEELGSRLGTHVSLELDPGVMVSASVREDLLRIVREAVTNAARHGTAGEVSIRLYNHDGVRVRIADDGSGFDLDAVAASLDGFGLTSMSERAARHGGVLTLTSEPGSGTVVEVVLP